jgi:hypothetical protein
MGEGWQGGWGGMGFNREAFVRMGTGQVQEFVSRGSRELLLRKHDPGPHRCSILILVNPCSAQRLVRRETESRMEPLVV